MKNCMSCIVLFFSVMCFPLAAAEFNCSGQTSNFAFNNDGALSPGKPREGFAVSVQDQLNNLLDGKISFEMDPVNGNLLSARALWHASFMELSAGPSFGVLNSSGNKHSVPVLFQPGLGIGFSITMPGKVIVRADTDFALPPATSSDGQVYIQRSELSLGFYLPNDLCTLKISQRQNTLEKSDGSRIKSITDYGFCNEIFKKGSPFRFSVDFIYRVQDFYISEDSDSNCKIGNLVLGGGLTWAPKADFSIFMKGNGSIYSFSLRDKINDLDRFHYDFTVGMRIVTKMPKGLD